MRYKHYQNANVDISAIAVGTWAIGGFKYGDVNRDDSIDAIHAMIENGVNLIDTAPAYGFGKSEMIVGEAIKEIPRDKIYISTKGGICPTTGEGRGTINNATYKAIIADCERSLGCLEQDYVDFYYIHWPDPETSLEETMSALNDLKKQGKIRFIGLSNHDEALITEASKYGQVDVIQPPFNMINQQDLGLMKWSVSKGISTMTYGSLGAGILTGAVRSMPELAPNDFRLTFYDYYREPKFSNVMTLLKTLDEIAQAHNVPVAQVTINWSTQKDYVSTALIGVRNRNEAMQNVAAFDWSLTNEEISQIDTAISSLGLDQ